MRQDQQTQTPVSGVDKAILEAMPSIESFKGHQLTGDTELVIALREFFGGEIHATICGVASATAAGEAVGTQRSMMRQLGWVDYPTSKFPARIRELLMASQEVMVIRRELLDRIHASERADSKKRVDPVANANAEFDPSQMQIMRAPAYDGGAVTIQQE